MDRVVRRARDAGIEEANGTAPEGNPYEVIVETVDERDCDRIVMGSHGRAQHQPYVLGSVTARVLQHSPVEVLVVPPHGTDR